MSRLEQLKEFLQKDPGDPFLIYAMAIEFVGQNNDDEAKRLLEELKGLHPDYTALYYHLGEIYQREGKKDIAEEIYREGIVRTSKKREQHQLAELQSALNNMLFDEE